MVECVRSGLLDRGVKSESLETGDDHFLNF